MAGPPTNTRRPGICSWSSAAVRRAGVGSVLRAHPDRDRDDVVVGPDGFDEGLGGSVGAEVDHCESLAADDVAEDRDRHRVLVAGRGADHHGGALAAAAGEGRSEPSDDADGDTRRAVFIGDVEHAAGPRVADLAEHRDQELEVDVLGGGARDEGAFDDRPRAGLVAGHEPITQPVPVGAPADSSRSRSRRLLFGQGAEVADANLPGAVDLPGGECPDPHVPVRGHVVDAECFGSGPEADELLVVVHCGGIVGAVLHDRDFSAKTSPSGIAPHRKA